MSFLGRSDTSLPLKSAELSLVRYSALWLTSRSALILGAFLVSVMVLLWIGADLVTHQSPIVNDFKARLGAPSMSHPFGTDNFGRDILSRVLHGIGVSLEISLPVVILTGFFGTLLGMACVSASAADWPLMRLTDALLAFPGLLLAIAVAATLGPSIPDAIFALSLTFLPRTARTMRAAMLGLMHQEFVSAARLAGTSTPRIMLRHILPNVLPILIVQQTFVFALAILSEAVLSFLGIGAIPPTPSLGNIIADGRDFIPVAPWISFYPGATIVVLVLGLNLLGDGLRDVLDPRIKVAVR
jgi:peptide/nickel transport system permease protein